MNSRHFLLFAQYIISSHLSLAQPSCEGAHMDVPLVNTIRLSTGVELQYVEQGAVSGTPVIFLHGYTDSWYSFEKVMLHLPPSIHAYSLSQRGHGLSSKPGNGYAPEDFSADLNAFMEQLHIPEAIIVGHSMGSLVAQRFAIDHPERTNGLVLIGAIASVRNNMGLMEFSKIIETLNDPVDSVFVYEFQKSTLAKDIPGMELHTFVSESRQVPASIWKAVMKGMLTADYVQELKKVKAPTLIVYGDKDAIIPASDQDTLTSTISNSLLVTYKGAGHGLHWEEPERFADDLLGFINKLQMDAK